ncbi:alpha/beta hydrolase-fold protein [Mycoplasmatota bacterium WC44]
MNNEIKSPIIEALKIEIENGYENSLDNFWNSIEENGAPLVELIDNDEKNVLVTVVWKDEGDIETIAVFGEIFGTNTEETKLESLLEANLWYKTYKVPSDSRSLYVFFINEELDAELEDIDVRVDPLNKNLYICKDDADFPEEFCVLFKEESMIEFPDFKMPSLVMENKEVEEGKIKYNNFQTNLGDRRAWLYTPASLIDSNESRGLVVFLDGWEYLFETKANVILDNMISEGLIPPVHALFIDSRADRMGDFTFNDDFLNLVKNDLLNWATTEVKIDRDPNKTVLVGFSLGSIMASYMAIKEPKIFGNVLSQSGAFYWEPSEDESKRNQIIKQFNRSKKENIDFYLSIGNLERVHEEHFNANLEMYKTLRDKGYNVSFEENPGGHTNFDCAITLPQGLKSLLKK